MKVSKNVGEIHKSNFWGDVEILERVKDKVKVKFLDSGNIGWFLYANVTKGKAHDSKTYKEKLDSWKDCDETFINNAGEEFTAFSKRGSKLKVVFTKTGYTAEVFRVNALAGKVNDPYTPSRYGVGYLGEHNKKSENHKQSLQLWQNMMKRCYSTKDPRGYYGRAFVSDRWLCYANFYEDIKHLENYDKWIEGQLEGATKYNLDKDTIKDGNNVYSRHLCRFITEFENKSLGKLGKKKEDWERK